MNIYRQYVCFVLLAIVAGAEALLSAFLNMLWPIFVASPIMILSIIKATELYDLKNKLGITAASAWADLCRELNSVRISAPKFTKGE